MTSSARVYCIRTARHIRRTCIKGIGHFGLRDVFNALIMLRTLLKLILDKVAFSLLLFSFVTWHDVLKKALARCFFLAYIAAKVFFEG